MCSRCSSRSALIRTRFLKFSTLTCFAKAAKSSGFLMSALGKGIPPLGHSLTACCSASFWSSAQETWSCIMRGISEGALSALRAPSSNFSIRFFIFSSGAPTVMMPSQNSPVLRLCMGRSGATLVAGTATPRPESWVELERIDLPERVDSQPLPAVELLDMRERSGRAGALHERTREALERLRDEGGKGIVLVNRRGYAPHLSCRSCGRAWGCPECDVSLVVHRRAERLACHHCGHREQLPSQCPDCGSVTLSRFGAGSERIEDEIAELLAPLPVLRLDSDSVAGGGGHMGVLRRFQEERSAVLVGTQMVAKGHDFADVTLSVVLDADASLRFPDFRAEERTFALVSQLAGRSGRGAAGGRVLVQTLAPESESIVAAARHDAAGFIAGELARRRELDYPPYASLVRVEVTAEEGGAAERAAAMLAERIAPALPDGAAL